MHNQGTDQQKANAEAQTENNGKGRGVRNLIQLLDGSILTKSSFVAQVPFILMLTILSIVYIGNRNHAEGIVKQNINLQKEVRELRAESISIASELMTLSRQSEVLRQIQDRGIQLKEALEPPKRLVINADDYK